MKLLSLNIGRPRAVPYTDQPEGVTGIDKRPVDGPVRVTAPGPKGVGASGLAGDAVCDLRHHGGNDQAVYAVAREDLDDWGRELGRPLASGAFGENLTTEGLDLAAAIPGERWRVGSTILEIAQPRLPCSKLGIRVGDPRFVKRFLASRRVGAYLRIVQEGDVGAGDDACALFQKEAGLDAAPRKRAEADAKPRAHVRHARKRQEADRPGRRHGRRGRSRIGRFHIRCRL